MPEVYTIPLSKIIHELQLETAFLPKSADDILIQSRDVVRPGMELNGYHEYFDPNRIAVLGRAEMYMLESLKPERRAMALDSYLSLKPPAVIVSRGIDPGKDFMEIAETYHVPVLRTTESTSNVVASLVAYLNVELAPRITRHGVLVEVYGEGILLVGDSGVGKSETAIELVKRGPPPHRGRRGGDPARLRQEPRRLLARKYPPLHGAARRGHHQRPPPLRHRRGQDDREDQHDRSARTVGRRQGVRPDGHERRIHRGARRADPVADHPGEAGAQPRHHHRSRGNEQPPKAHGYNAAQELLEKLGMVEPDGGNPTDWGDF